MTKYPLVFITGRRSLFYFLGYWNQIPHFLSSHGFEVIVLHLNWNNVVTRKNQISQSFLNLQKNRQKIHLFIDRGSLSEIIFLLEKRDFECISSITLLGKSGLLPPYRLKIPIFELELKTLSTRAPLFWRLHSLLTHQFQPKSSSETLEHLGWKLRPDNGYLILDRVQDLAESDLIHGSSSPSLKTIHP